MKEFEKERSERRKVRKRTKAAQPAKDKEGDVQMGDASSSTAPQPPAESSSTPVTEADADGEKGKAVAGAELEDESVYREKEGKELDALVHPDLKEDVGASVTGQYELVGASLPPRFLFFCLSLSVIGPFSICQTIRCSASRAFSQSFSDRLLVVCFFLGL